MGVCIGFGLRCEDQRCHAEGIARNGVVDDRILIYSIFSLLNSMNLLDTESPCSVRKTPIDICGAFFRSSTIP